MGRFRCSLVLVSCLLAQVGTARADSAPALVIPSRPDLPVMINGYDASWGVVEGDWGLYRPGAVSPTVIPAPTAMPLAPARPWYPSLGAAPHAGRYEVEPPANRVLPPPAQSYHRDWSSSSDMSVPAAPPGPQVVAPSAEFNNFYPNNQRNRRGPRPGPLPHDQGRP
jgi:hypothetical protein